MSKAVSRGQALQVSARVATQVDWDELDGEELQVKVINLSPEEFGRKLTRFLKNGCGFIIGEMRKLTLPDSFNPEDFPGLGKGWGYWRGPLNGKGKGEVKWTDPRATAIKEFDSTTLIFETGLKAGDKSIKGFEKLRRLVKKSEFVRYDLRAFPVLWEDYQQFGKDSILEKIYQSYGVEVLEFMDPLRSPDGSCFILYFCRDSVGRWDWSFRWLGYGWGARGFSVGYASSPQGLESLG